MFWKNIGHVLCCIFYILQSRGNVMLSRSLTLLSDAQNLTRSSDRNNLYILYIFTEEVSVTVLVPR